MGANPWVWERFMFRTRVKSERTPRQSEAATGRDGAMNLGRRTESYLAESSHPGFIVDIRLLAQFLRSIYREVSARADRACAGPSPRERSNAGLEASAHCRQWEASSFPYSPCQPGDRGM